MRLREERRKMEDGGRGNRVQWLNQCVFQGNMIIFQLDSLCYLSGNLLFSLSSNHRTNSTWKHNISG